MKKIYNFLIILAFSSINIKNIHPRLYENLNHEEQADFNTLIEYSNQNNLKDFVKLIGQKENFKLTDVEDKNLVNIIGYNKHNKKIHAKEEFIYTIFIYSMLSESILQSENNSNVKRFHKIKKQLYEYLEAFNTLNVKLNPQIVKALLSKEIAPKTKELKNTSFHWYLYNKVILNKKVLNPCLKNTLKWFLDEIRLCILNEKLNGMKEILNFIPFLIGLKINNQTLSSFIKKHLKGQSKSDALNYIKNTEKLFRKKEPWFFTAFNRYNSIWPEIFN